MIAHVKLALLLALFVAIIAVFGVDADRYDDCRGGWYGWRDRGYRGDYYCDGRRWDRDGRYYNGGRWYGPGDRGGFYIGVGR